MKRPAVNSSDPGMLVYKRPSGIGLPGLSLFFFAVRKYNQSCNGLISVPMRAPTVIASCTRPVWKMPKLYESPNVWTTELKNRNRIPHAKEIQRVKKMTTGSVRSILVGRLNEIFSNDATEGLSSSDSA